MILVQLDDLNSDDFVVKFVKNKLHLELTSRKEFKVKSSKKSSGINFISIYKGYQTDGMSIPRFLRPFIGEPFEGNTLRAALVHDFLCCIKQRRQLFTHALFREILIKDGVNPVRAWVCWLGVVVFNILKNQKWDL